MRVKYREFLGQFRRTVVTTPVAASVATARENFKPALVLMDDEAAIRELTSLTGIAFFSPRAWILTGDPMQAPYKSPWSTTSGKQSDHEPFRSDP